MPSSTSNNTPNIPKVHCPNCGVESKEKKIYAYGSPIVKCHKCQVEYYDDRFHEIALDGIRPEDQTTIREAITIIGVGIIIGAASLGFNWLTSTYLGRIWIIFVFGVIFGVLAILYGIYKTFAILTGAEKRRWERLTAESKQRVSDPAYIMRLQDIER